MAAQSTEDGGLKIGDRVAVNDPFLAQMREIMRRNGHEPQPNHTGYIEEIHGEDAYIIFDDTGSMAPYPLADCQRLRDGGDHA